MHMYFSGQKIFVEQNVSQGSYKCNVFPIWTVILCGETYLHFMYWLTKLPILGLDCCICHCSLPPPPCPGQCKPCGCFGLCTWDRLISVGSQIYLICCQKFFAKNLAVFWFSNEIFLPLVLSLFLIFQYSKRERLPLVPCCHYWNPAASLLCEIAQHLQWELQLYVL